MGIPWKGQNRGVGGILGLAGYRSIAPRHVVHAGIQTKVYVTKTLCLTSYKGNRSSELSPSIEPHLDV